MDATEKRTTTAIALALGAELRRAREAGGWSRAQFVARLPSGIGDRTLLSYEHGTRHMTVPRLLELCHGLGVAAPTLLSQALQKAQVHLSTLVLRVDLRQLVNHRNEKFRPMVQWARNKLNKHPDGIVELEPSVVLELADFIGCSQHDLAAHLIRFSPGPDDTDDSTDDTVATGPRREHR